MSLFHKQFEEQTNLLREKGYDEKSIGSPDKEGWLFNQLRNSFSYALRQSLTEDEPILFKLCTAGFFNDDREIIHFHFTYSFDSQKADLSLKEFELRSNGIIRKIPIHLPNDLPHSSQALKLIEEQKQISQDRLNKYRSVYTTKKGYDSSIQNEPRKGKRK